MTADPPPSPGPRDEPCRCGTCGHCWYQHVRGNPENMATWELRDAYQAAGPDSVRRRLVAGVIRARGYRVAAPPPPHSGPVRLVAAP